MTGLGDNSERRRDDRIRELVGKRAASGASAAELSRYKASLLAEAGQGDAAALSLLDAATREFSRGDLDRSATDCDQALTFAASDRVRAAVAEMHARIGGRRGHSDEGALWSAAAAAYAAAGNLDAQVRCIFHAHRSSDDRRPVPESARGGGWWHACAAWTAFGDAQYEEVVTHCDTGLAMARLRSDQELEMRLLCMQVAALGAIGVHGPIAALLDECCLLAERLDDVEVVISTRMNMCELALEQLDLAAAEQIATHLEVYLDLHGCEEFMPLALSVQASVLERQGRVAAAYERSTAAWEMRDRLRHGDDRAWVAFVHAQLTAEVGTDEAVDEMLYAASDVVAGASYGALATELDLARIVRSGSTHNAQELAATIAAGTLEQDSPTAARVAVIAARVACSSNSPGLAAAASRLADQVDPECGSPLIQLQLDETRALIEARDNGSGDRLDLIARRWERAGWRLEAARTRRARASLELVARRRSRALELLQACHREFVSLGALAEIDPLLVQLAELGAGGDSSADCGCATSEIFRDIDSAAISHIEHGAVRRTIPKGGVVFDHASQRSIVLVRAGSLRVVREGDGGQRLGVDVVGPGSLIGAHPLVGGDDTVVGEALQPCTIFAITPERLRGAMAIDPTIGIRLVEMVAERASRALRRTDQIASLSVEQRLTHVILDLAGRFGRHTIDGNTVIDLPLTHEHLAEMVGSTRKTVTRMLSALREGEAIDLRRRRIVILASGPLASRPDDQPGSDSRRAA